MKNLVDDLVRVKALLWSRIDRGLIAADVLPLAPLSMIEAIQAHGTCRVQDLAIESVLTTGGASQAVDRLVERGLCRRVDNPSDRRSSLIQVTEQGDAEARAARAVCDRLLEEIFEPLSDENRKALAEMLSGLRASLG